MELNASNSDEIINFVPREVCVVVSNDGPADDGWHEQVRRDLNRRVARGLGAASTDSPDPLARDLAPRVLKQHYGSIPELLQPLVRPGTATSAVHLPGAGSRRTSLCFFRLGAHPEETTSAERERDRHATRELVNLINHHLPAGDGAGAAPVVAATPNWLTAATEHTCGGPASLPRTVSARGNWMLRFAHPELATLVEAARARRGQPIEFPNVVVAVLDASPTRQQVERATARYPANRLLREVSDQVAIDGPLSLGSADFQHVHGILPNWHDGSPTQNHSLDAYRMPDHGLFSCGIIEDLAPAAEIHLIRALNDHGVGDVHALTRVLRDLPARLRRIPRQRLVINLSLMADLPPRERLRHRWFPELGQDDTEWQRQQPRVEETIALLHRGLHEAIGWLNDQDVLVVAAAGNDALMTKARPEPRYPARYDNVFGVAAVDRQGEPAAFSNRGDEVVLGNGVATFGGNAARARAGDLPVIADAGGRPDAIVGIYSGEQLPLSDETNTSGWVYWAGTSFSTPIITGIAADLWAADPSLAPREVIDAVISRYATPRNRALDCPVILADQEAVE